MLLRTRNSNLQEEARRTVSVTPGLLWLVVGGSERALKVRSDLNRRVRTGARNLFRFNGRISAAIGIPQRPARRSGLKSAFHRSGAFTLMELLLVLALLAMAVAVAAPSLSRFFRGRALDSETRRMLSLTRYAQSRAVSEGIPMVMWFKPEEKAYGVQAEMTYDESDRKAVEYTLDSNLELELPPASLLAPAPWKITTQIAGNQPAIRFTPDGYVSDTSPVWVAVKLSDETDAVWLALDDHRVRYALQTVQPLASR